MINSDVFHCEKCRMQTPIGSANLKPVISLGRQQIYATCETCGAETMIFDAPIDMVLNPYKKSSRLTPNEPDDSIVERKSDLEKGLAALRAAIRKVELAATHLSRNNEVAEDLEIIKRMLYDVKADAEREAAGADFEWPDLCNQLDRLLNTASAHRFTPSHWELTDEMRKAVRVAGRHNWPYSRGTYGRYGDLEIYDVEDPLFPDNGLRLDDGVLFRMERSALSE